MTPRTKEEEDVLAELIAAAGGLGAGGTLTALVNKAMSRRADKVDILERLEKISANITDRAVAQADQRVQTAEVRAELAEERSRSAESQARQVDQRMTDYLARETEREARRSAALTQHAAWDKAVAARLEDLGAAVGPPPPLE